MIGFTVSEQMHFQVISISQPLSYSHPLQTNAVGFSLQVMELLLCCGTLICDRSLERKGNPVLKVTLEMAAPLPCCPVAVGGLGTPLAMGCAALRGGGCLKASVPHVLS